MPRQKSVILAMVAGTLFASPAFAQKDDESSLSMPKYFVKNAGNADVVLVWKDSKAHDKGIDLIMNGVQKTHPEMIERLLACIVPNNTPVIVESPGIFSTDITVIDGEDAGCEGNISSNDLKQARK